MKYKLLHGKKRTFIINVLLDDGYVWGTTQDAESLNDAYRQAFDDARLAGLRPVRVCNSEEVTTNE